jgi:hypothetical protein
MTQDTNQPWTQTISDLMEEDRRPMLEQVKLLSFVLRQCQSRLQCYETGDTVLHLLFELDMAREYIAQVRGELIKKYKLPTLADYRG